MACAATVLGSKMVAGCSVFVQCGSLRDRQRPSVGDQGRANQDRRPAHAACRAVGWWRRAGDRLDRRRRAACDPGAADHAVRHLPHTGNGALLRGLIERRNISVVLTQLGFGHLAVSIR